MFPPIQSCGVKLSKWKWENEPLVYKLLKMALHFSIKSFHIVSYNEGFRSIGRSLILVKRDWLTSRSIGSLGHTVSSETYSDFIIWAKKHKFSCAKMWIGI